MAIRGTRARSSRTGGWWPRSRISASRRSSSSRRGPTPRRSSRRSSIPAPASRGSSWRVPHCTRSSWTSWAPRPRRRQRPAPATEAPVHKVWAVIRREFVERVRTKWFWFSAIIGPVLSIGVIVFQIMQTMGGGVRNIAIVDSTSTGFGVRIAENLSATRFVAARLPARAGLVDSLTQLVSNKQLDGFLIVSDEITESGRAEYRAASLSMQTIEELQRTLNRLVVKARLEGKGVNPAVVDWAQ